MYYSVVGAWYWTRMELEGLIESGAVTLKPLEKEEEKEKKMDEEESETATADAATDAIHSHQMVEMDTGSTGAGVSVRTDIIVAIESSDTTSAAMAFNSGDMELRNSENVLEFGLSPNSSIHPILNIENTNENQSDNEKNNENEKINLSSFITIVEPELAILTFEEFCQALYPLKYPWSQRDDEVIAMFVNRVSDKLDLDPLMISCAVLENQRIISGLLPDRSSSEIQARYAALSVLNKVRSKLFVQFHLAVLHFFRRF